MASTEYIKSLVRHTMSGIHAANYNHSSKKAALRALAQIEKERGKLSRTLKQTADSYAIEVLGGKVYAPWLYVYSAIAGTFKEGWIPDNYYHLVTIPKIQGEYGKISFLKPLNRKIFNTSISPDVAFFINGEWFDIDFRKIKREVLGHIAFTENDRVVFKTDRSFQGRGVFIRRKPEFSATDLEGKGNGTLQKYIEQHPFFIDLLSGSVATLRLTTVIDQKGDPDIRSSYLRLGRADDSHVKSDSHVRVPIYVGSGKMHDHGYMTDWRTVTHHPDSLMTFSKKTIPRFQECVLAALELHKSFPMVKAIGWDFAIDSNSRPILMEWNGYGNDIKFSEATQGPCFKDLEWVKLQV